MRIHRMLRWTLGAAALALVLGSVASRLTAQPPRAVSVRPEVSGRPIAIDRGAAALWQRYRATGGRLLVQRAMVNSWARPSGMGTAA